MNLSHLTDSEADYIRRILKLLAQEALEVQSACSLKGVVSSFKQARDLLLSLQEHGLKLDTMTFNSHPIMVLWASKIASLTACEDRFSSAYAEVQEWAAHEEETPSPPSN